MIKGKLQSIEIKLTATPTAGNAGPMTRFITAAGDEAWPHGVLVCCVAQERVLPQGHQAMPWQLFPQWLGERLS